MLKSKDAPVGRVLSRRLSLFEKVILVNSLVLVGEALSGLWITSHALENHHYLIDTLFIVGATVLSLLINILLLRASFRPLFSLLATIRAISAGKTQARAPNLPADTEIGELALAFNSMLDRLEETRREQAILILQAQEEERRRVALELHDESSQNLTALLVHTEILQQSLQSLPATSLTAEAREQLCTGLQQLTRLSQRTLESIRTLALQLRPGVLDDLGLYAALRWLAEDCRERLHMSVDLSLQTLPGRASGQQYPALYETTLFRVAQESLTNVARHAQATHVSITLTQDEQCIYLRIRDNGQGYETTQRRSGLGISGMQERVSLLNGTFSLTSEAGQGTIVEATLPLLEATGRARKEHIYA
ncbi:MAG TPA: HAMP domain-containing sensor histidine kinase [Ktedonobacteraceae bacterium]|nr:HAMP domain-containing sensor histidine kinase [Ktedonobacteraceae bacterium]